VASLTSSRALFKGGFKSALPQRALWSLDTSEEFHLFQNALLCVYLQKMQLKRWPRQVYLGAAFHRVLSKIV